MFVQQLEPVADSLAVSALVATLPLVTVLVLLGAVRMRAHRAGLIGLAVAVAVSSLAYGMPLGQTLSAGAQGVLFGLFPIMWIVVNALWVYRMTVRTQHFDILRRSFSGSRTTLASRRWSSPSASARSSKPSPDSVRPSRSPP